MIKVFLWVLAIGFVLSLFGGKGKKRQAKKMYRHENEELSRPRSVPSRPKGPPVRWLPKGESVNIGGLSIGGGMIYLGSPDASPWNALKCVVDPTLPVAPSRPDVSGEQMNYWPSYSLMQPSSRLAYLQWLASDRSDPDAYIGYVFLYFYGLEQRLLKEGSSAEADTIIAEVDRLRSIYGKNHSFHRYSTAFIDAATLLKDQALEERPPAPRMDSGYEIPIGLRINLGALLEAGNPLNADWMLAWYLAHPETRLRTPARRAFDEFCQLFRLRFDATYPEGLRVTPPKARIGKIPYRSASADFDARLDGSFANFPDVTRLMKPVTQAGEIADRCTTDLESYSRFLGRSAPDARESLQAKFLLPRDLLMAAGEDVDNVRKWLDSAGVVPVGTALGRVGIAAKDGTIGKADARGLAEAVERLGFGVEPDVRLGGRTPKVDDSVVIFRLPDGELEQPPLSDAYKAAAMTVSLCALVAHADNVVTEEEERHVLGLVESNLNLPPLERVRLEALARSDLSSPTSLSAFRSKVATISEDRRHDLARFVIALAAADGHIAVEEIKLMERIYKALGFEQTRLFSDLHALEGDRDEPVVVRPASDVGTGRKIPREKARQEVLEKGADLDMERVARIRQDTAKVSSLLADIFVDDSTLTEETGHVDETEKAGAFDGLDRRHEALLAELLGRPEWAMEDFEKLCRAMDLMPGGALETLNEWAFERFDEAIAEDGDPIFLNLALLEPDHSP